MNERLKKFPWREAALPCFATLSVLALVFRLSSGVMDLLLSLNLAIAATIFLSTFFIRKPLEFSSFPTVLLTTTLFRLALNVSTTRLILTQGNAGKVIDAFSRFVAGDSIVVGGVVFLIFIAIQFVVITKGATRISEVSARFALDAMPGRQSAIDFDLNAGNITAEEARAMRAELAEQADFFGAMDGAGKFVRGDAIAGLLIVAINIIGGLCIGVAQNHLSVSEAASLYMKLTIGDGLVSQIPAFLISMATGLLVARSSRAQSVSDTAVRQTFGKPVVLTAVGFFLIVLAFTGLPFAPLLTLAAGCFVLAWALSRRSDEAEEQETEEADGKGAKGKTKKNPEEEDVERFMTVDPIEIEIGAGLITIAEPAEGATLLERVRAVRQKIAAELGLILPKVYLRDDPALDEDHFVVKINGDVVLARTVYPNLKLAVDPGFVVGPLKALSAKAPDGVSAAFWVDDSMLEQATDFGYRVLSPGEMMEELVLQTVRNEAAALLTRDGTKRLVERLRDVAPTLVDEALGAQETSPRIAAMRLAKIQRVLQLLLTEGASIRRLDVILEALNDLDLREPDADAFRALQYVRERMARLLSAQYRDEDGELHALTLDPALEDLLRERVETANDGAAFLALRSSEADKLAQAFREQASYIVEASLRPVLLVDGAMRYALRETLKDACPTAVFMAYDEVDRSTKISREGTIVCELEPNA